MKKQLIFVLPLMVLSLITSCIVSEEIAAPQTDCPSEFLQANRHDASDKLDSVMQKTVNEGLTGAVALLISAEKGSYVGAFGSSDLGTSAAMVPCQKFRVASLTKMFTAAMTLILVEDSAFTLSSSVGAYLKDDPRVQGIDQLDEVTVAQLLNHTSGIPNYDDNILFAPMILNEPGRHITLEQKLELAKGRGRVPKWVIKKFGQIYSNTNYLLLQLMIEKATGKPYTEVVRTHIIEPLQLSNTLFGSEDPYPDLLATGYVDFYGNDVMRNVNEWDTHRFDAEGDLISTASDLATFYEALFNGRLISDALLDQMKSDRLGMLQETFEFENAMGHDGIAIGYSAEMWYLPESRLIVILLSNQGRLINENWSVLRFENLLRQLIEVGR